MAKEMILRIRVVTDKPMQGYDEHAPQVRAEFVEMFKPGADLGGGVTILYSEIEIDQRDVPENKYVAVCTFCEQEMTDGKSCTMEAFSDFDDGVTRVRIPWEGYVLEELGPYATDMMRRGHCSDCATPKGGFHHPGCDNEKCPKCDGQAISCGCPEGAP